MKGTTMSELKLGEKAMIEVEIAEINSIGLIRAKTQGGGSVWVKESMLKAATTQPVDVSAIRVGDDISMTAEVLRIDRDDRAYPFLVRFGKQEKWIDGECIASHTPKPFALPDDAASRFATLSDCDKRKVLAVLEGKN